MSKTTDAMIDRMNSESTPCLNLAKEEVAVQDWTAFDHLDWMAEVLTRHLIRSRLGRAIKAAMALTRKSHSTIPPETSAPTPKRSKRRTSRRTKAPALS